MFFCLLILQGMDIGALSFLFTQSDWWLDHGTHVIPKIHLFCNVRELVSQIPYIYFIKICVYIVSDISQSNNI